ncbi:sulfate/molybdate ABC transporter ATP-binding protein [Celeribacter indicus]|uniref:Sulfate ABC transporter ATPase n=1 Tax=Celeribacter indicus TaxID=1208324 RepID=A0A0B5E068_9RHOB|nr:sulfate/molybdate ABC transporter ATP-binding protein [Celeribacter indicus]AJE45852.1 sulfate ABC transporter ATPase [Celeribacter indicus]SDW62271.1 sulfate transport system ATP-binding protein [Celeribacter indicus]
MSITVRNITKSFNGTPVLKGVDLAVEKGELVALLGPSGSGKTTLLKIIAGLEWPETGALDVDGEDWFALPARDRRIGFVFQHYALFPHMSVRENIAFGLRVRPKATRPSRADILTRADELLRFLQIPHLADRYPGQLSGGQKQRVALGRALAIEPKVLLLDEPFGALDAAIRRDLRRWLREVHDATGSTTIFVTHDQEEAFELADRVVVMGEGRIEQIGHADLISDRPASPFVARFMGATVTLPVRIQGGRAQAAGLDLSALPDADLPDGPAELFLRPEDIRPEAATGAGWRITSRSSNGTRLHLALADDSATAAEAEIPRRGADPTLSEGCEVRLHIAAGALFASPAPAGRTPELA